MASTLDPDSFSENGKPVAKGHDKRSLGPGDSSDSGSDIAGQEIDGDDADVEVNRDIGADRIVTAEEAGLGGGFDQAEEAQLGITDEELAEDPDADRAPADHRKNRR